MPGIKGIVRAFGFFRKAAYAFILAQGMELLLAAGNEFVSVCLMADVPDQFISRRIEYMVQGQGQFNYSQAGSS